MFTFARTARCHTTGTVHEGTTLRYQASKFDCEVCALKMQCCPDGPSRQVSRDVHEHARDVTRRLMRTSPHAQTIKSKLQKIQPPKRKGLVVATASVAQRSPRPPRPHPVASPAALKSP